MISGHSIIGSCRFHLLAAVKPVGYWALSEHIYVFFGAGEVNHSLSLS
jgi:hypothetical protein